MAQRQSTRCIHRWVLSEPQGESIRGVCRRCGARRTYPSGLEIPVAALEFEELDTGLPVLAAQPSSAEGHALA